MITMTAASAVPHKTKIEIVKRHVKPEVLASARTVWGRELKLITQLLVRYPDPDFWLDLGLGYSLHSLAFFKMERGMQELETAWRYYKLTGTVKSIPLDNPTKPTSMGVDPETAVERIEQGSALTLPS